jgi:hypothetical protein
LVESWDGRGWKIERAPSPSFGGALQSVSCPSAVSCIAVGQQPTGALAERWNGRGWTLLSAARRGLSPRALGDLSQVSCAAATFCIAVGDYKLINDDSGTSWPLAERWNGHRWKVTPASKLPGFLTGVSCSSARACTAVGESDAGHRAGSLVERWNGARWTIQPTPAPPTPPNAIRTPVTGLYAVSCRSPSACVAVGSIRTVTFDHTSPRPPQNVEIPFAEQWDGAGWAVQPTPSLTSPISSLHGLACTSTIFCLAVGYSGSASSNSTLVEGYG